MTTVLHIDSSVRAAKNDNPSHDSISKNIAKRFINTLKQQQTIDEYIYRDVGINPPPFITQDWIGAVFTPNDKKSDEQRQLLALSDQLIAEIAAAEIIVISSPMYNYGMPAQLKAWFDQVIRINKTFDFDLARGDFPLQPLFAGKTLIIVTSTGEFGFEVGGVREHMSHLVPHLRTLSKYLGASTVFDVTSQYQEFNDERHKQSLINAYRQATELALKLCEKRS